jgi:hypothetical protein
VSSLTWEEAERYRCRMAGAGKASATDPMYQFQTTWLRSMLDLADMVMEDEGVPSEVRRKVVRGVLYGSPNVADAELRVEQREVTVRHLRETPVNPLVLAEFLNEGGEQR